MPNSPIKQSIFFIVSWGFLCLGATAISLQNEQQDPDDFFDSIGEMQVPPRPHGENREIPTNRDLGSGKITTTVGSTDDAARGAVIQSDGKIVAAGRSINNGWNDFAVVRYNPNGTLDTSFATNGKALTSFSVSPKSDEIAHAVFLQTDGKILAIGKTDKGIWGYYYFAIARFNANGALDTGFNTTGQVTTQLGNSTNIARAGVIDTAGRLTIAGYALNAGTYNAAMARYNIDGSTDTTFNTTGTTSTVLVASDNAFLALQIQTDAKLVAAGTGYTGNDWNMAVARFNTNGTIDASFGTNGKLIQPVYGTNGIAYAIAIPTTGKILVGGSTNNGSNLDFALIRYNIDGSFDTSFHTNGVLNQDINGHGDSIYGLKVQSDGGIWAGGYSNDGTFDDFAVARFLNNGSLDTSFHTNGKAITIINGANERAQAIASLGDTYFILAGRTITGSRNNFAVVRYNTDGSVAPSGTFDQSFGTNGSVRLHFFGTSDEGLSIALQTNGAIIAAGGTLNPADGCDDFGVARLNQNGTLDTTFNTTGQENFNFGMRTTADLVFSVIIQTDARILTGGSNATSVISVSGNSLARLNTDGSLDTAFNTTGKAINTVGGVASAVYGAALQTDGKSVAVGNLLTHSGIATSSNFAISRYNVDGTIDTSFDTVGNWAGILGSLGTFGSFYSVLLQTDGKAVAGGGIGATSQPQFVVTRFMVNGSVDTSFFTAGFNTISFSVGIDNIKSIALAKDGKIVAGGSTGTQVAFARFNIDGSLDTTFNTTGSVATVIGTIPTINGIVMEKGGEITGVGSAYTPLQQFLLVRYLTNGSLDTALNTVGFSLASVIGTGETGQAVVLQSDGRILTIGYGGVPTCFTLIRYWP